MRQRALLVPAPSLPPSIFPSTIWVCLSPPWAPLQTSVAMTPGLWEGWEIGLGQLRQLAGALGALQVKALRSRWQVMMLGIMYLAGSFL